MYGNAELQLQPGGGRKQGNTGDAGTETDTATVAGCAIVCFWHSSGTSGCQTSFGLLQQALSPSAHLPQAVVQPVVMGSKALQLHQLPLAAGAGDFGAVVLQAVNDPPTARFDIRAQLGTVRLTALLHQTQHADVTHCQHELAGKGHPAVKVEAAADTFKHSLFSTQEDLGRSRMHTDKHPPPKEACVAGKAGWPSKRGFLPWAFSDRLYC